MSFWVSKTNSVSVCPAWRRLSRAPSAPPRPRDRVTRAIHDSTTCYRRKNEPQRQTRRAGGAERSPPADFLLGPRKSCGSAGKKGLPPFPEVFPFRAFFRVPCFGIPLYGRRFTGDGTLPSPPGIFSYPRVFRLSGRAPTFVRTGPCFRASPVNFFLQLLFV